MEIFPNLRAQSIFSFMIFIKKKKKSTHKRFYSSKKGKREKEPMRLKKMRVLSSLVCNGKEIVDKRIRKKDECIQVWRD